MLLARGRYLFAGLATAALAASLPSLAAANTTTVTFSVTAQVSTSCFLTATNLNFGPYASTQLDGTATLSATCSTGTPYNLGLNQGTHSGSTVTTRQMGGPGA